MDLQLGLFDDQPLTGEYPIPSDGQTAVCRSCDAPIVWTRTEGGKAIPLSLKTARTLGDTRYATTHFADCPHSRDWRHR